MPSNFFKDDPIYGPVDLDEEFVTDAWLVDKYVGGTLFSWDNSNLYGQVGNGTISNYNSPVQIGALVTWKQITKSYQSALGIKTDGTLWAWGRNNFGQLGNSTLTNYSSPVQIGSLTNWKQVSLGGDTCLAVKTDGTLWAWGSNAYRSLGTNNTTDYSSPIQIGSLQTWEQVSAGGQTTFAIKKDGTLWAWGWCTSAGWLGNGVASNTLYYSSPIQVGSLTNWKYVSQGAAIKTDGTLWTWGSNSYGQIGNGSVNINYSSPIQVGSLTDWKLISGVLPGVALAIKTDGTLWVWGGNADGQLGIGTRTYFSSPIQVGSLTNWKYVTDSGTGNMVSAIKTDGTLWGWGYNLGGNLGNGSSVSYSSPVQIGSLTNWKASGIRFGIQFSDLN
jgi:alpha-tubulin suppressor-like RCC1 family protein